MAMPKRDEMLKARGVLYFQCELKEALKSVGKGVVKSVGKSWGVSRSFLSGFAAFLG